MEKIFAAAGKCRKAWRNSGMGKSRSSPSLISLPLFRWSFWVCFPYGYFPRQCANREFQKEKASVRVFRSMLIINGLFWGVFGFCDTLQKLLGTNEWSLILIDGSHRVLHNSLYQYYAFSWTKENFLANRWNLVGLVGFMCVINYLCGATVVYIDTGKAHQVFPGMLKSISFLVRVPCPDSYNIQGRVSSMPSSNCSSYSYLTPVVYLFILVQIAYMQVKFLSKGRK